MENQQQSIIVDDEISVKQDLAAIGLSTELIRKVAFAAAAGRAESLRVDPVSAPGQLAYIHGVRELRLGLEREGWRINRDGNVEATVNYDLGIQLFFQNVDRACGKRNPQAISKKGKASRDLVAAGQTDMFTELSHDVDENVHGAVPAVWIVCISSDSQSVRAEVSRPKRFEGSQFEDFHHRIFVLDENFEPEFEPSVSDSDTFDDFDVNISRKI
ncbi:MAG TPA: hypothetical protein VFN01_17275 [Marinobacter sp.]|uniref:hypothetical protein n=1 Tax=Marinobacter sp. TaxID=50741 RepID=UPI002D7FC680|nr:hypothetical protein [Marinobacter sp.]HET8802923.1 hypothetical protein [Marinobacter sp.]